MRSMYLGPALANRLASHVQAEHPWGLYGTLWFIQSANGSEPRIGKLYYARFHNIHHNR